MYAHLSSLSFVVCFCCCYCCCCACTIICPHLYIPIKSYLLSGTLPSPQGHNRHHRSQVGAPEVPGLCGITSNWQLRIRVSNPCIHRLAQMHTCEHPHAQMNLSSQLWILFLLLLISISPNSCRGGTFLVHISNLALQYKPASPKHWP